MLKPKICLQKGLILISQDLLASKVQPVQSSVIYLVFKRKVSSSFNCRNIKKRAILFAAPFFNACVGRGTFGSNLFLAFLSDVLSALNYIRICNTFLLHYICPITSHLGLRQTTSYSVSIQRVMMLKVPLFAFEWAYEYSLNCLKLLLNLT